MIWPILIHWGWVMHICISEPNIIGSDNGLSPGRRQAIIWTNAGILLIGPLGTNFSEILIKIITFSFKKMYLKMSSAKRQPFCLGLNVLTWWNQVSMVKDMTLYNQYKDCYSHSMLVQWSGSTLAQEMACCLVAPSHYLSSKVFCGILLISAQDNNTSNEFKKIIIEITATSPRGQCINGKAAFEKKHEYLVFPHCCHWDIWIAQYVY